MTALSAQKKPTALPSSSDLQSWTGFSFPSTSSTLIWWPDSLEFDTKVMWGFFLWDAAKEFCTQMFRCPCARNQELNMCNVFEPLCRTLVVWNEEWLLHLFVDSVTSGQMWQEPGGCPVPLSRTSTRFHLTFPPPLTLRTPVFCDEQHYFTGTLVGTQTSQRIIHPYTCLFVVLMGVFFTLKPWVPPLAPVGTSEPLHLKFSQQMTTSIFRGCTCLNWSATTTL